MSSSRGGGAARAAASAGDAVPDERVIQRNAGVPSTFDLDAPACRKWERVKSNMAQVLLRDGRTPASFGGAGFWPPNLLVFNKVNLALGLPERVCFTCSLRFRALPEAAAQAAGAVEMERWLSGICSRACWPADAEGMAEDWHGRVASATVNAAAAALPPGVPGVLGPTWVLKRDDGATFVGNSALGVSSFTDARGGTTSFNTFSGGDAAGGGEHRCDVCAKTASKLCGACRLRRYCGEACQRADWRGGHKAMCKEVGEAVEAATEIAARAAAKRP